MYSERPFCKRINHVNMWSVHDLFASHHKDLHYFISFNLHSLRLASYFNLWFLICFVTISTRMKHSIRFCCSKLLRSLLTNEFKSDLRLIWREDNYFFFVVVVVINLKIDSEFANPFSEYFLSFLHFFQRIKSPILQNSFFFYVEKVNMEWNKWHSNAKKWWKQFFFYLFVCLVLLCRMWLILIIIYMRFVYFICLHLSTGNWANK